MNEINIFRFTATNRIILYNHQLKIKKLFDIIRIYAHNNYILLQFQPITLKFSFACTHTHRNKINITF